MTTTTDPEKEARNLISIIATLNYFTCPVFNKNYETQRDTRKYSNKKGEKAIYRNCL